MAPGPPHPAPSDPLVGQVLDGRYAIRARIAEGGMGVVYRATHTALQREVAIKVLFAHDPRSSRRLLREARAAAQVRHEHVVAIHDVGALSDGSPFLVMELLDGEPLDARLRREGRLEIVDAIDIATQVLSGLEAVHQAGIVHRDVKPANVFLLRGASPRSKLLDFGISKAEGEARMTGAGEIIGTPRYLAPEQARGVEHLDARVDLWAVGVMLYELLTGISPFDSPSLSGVITAVLIDQPPPVRDVRPEVSKALDRVIEIALSKEPGQRYDSATAMGLALARARRQAGVADATTVDAADELMDTLPGDLEPSTLVDDEPPDAVD